MIKKKISIKNAELGNKIESLFNLDKIGIKDFKSNLAIAYSMEALQPLVKAYQKSVSFIVESYVKKDDKGRPVEVPLEGTVPIQKVYAFETEEDNAKFIEERKALDDQTTEIDVYLVEEEQLSKIDAHVPGSLLFALMEFIEIKTVK